MTGTSRRAVASVVCGSLALVGVLAVTERPASAGPLLCDGRFSMGKAGHTVRLQVPLCTNKPLDRPDATVRRVLVVIHGASRNAADYFRYGSNAAALAGANDTLVVAPQFLLANDVQPMPADMMYFPESWREGGDSIGTRPWRESSYGVIDRIVTRVANRAVFPNLVSVVIAGHSAGGQFVNRFAAGSRIEQALAPSGYRFRYVVANPSTYLYLDGTRRTPGTYYQYAVPSATTLQSCPAYDRYKHGLASGLNRYMAATGADAIRLQYGARNVSYLLGELDTNPNHESLDRDCAAKLQGAHRLERGTIHGHHLGRFYGSGVFDRHLFGVVPGVGHEGERMLTSAVGRTHLFGTPTAPSPPPPPPPPPPTSTPPPSTTAAPTTTTTSPPPPGATVYLSDLAWTSVQNGLGPVERDRSVGGRAAGDGTPIRLQGTTYAKGLGTHPFADITYWLDRRYRRFLVDLGIDQVCGGAGSVEFRILLDGAIASSKRVTGASPVAAVSLDVTNRTTLRLLVTDGGDGLNCDHADWAGARLLS